MRRAHPRLMSHNCVMPRTMDGFSTRVPGVRGAPEKEAVSGPVPPLTGPLARPQASGRGTGDRLLGSELAAPAHRPSVPPVSPALPALPLRLCALGHEYHRRLNRGYLRGWGVGRVRPGASAPPWPPRDSLEAPAPMRCGTCAKRSGWACLCNSRGTLCFVSGSTCGLWPVFLYVRVHVHITNAPEYSGIISHMKSICPYAGGMEYGSYG